MRYQSLSKTNRVFSDIRIKNVILTGDPQEILTDDFFDSSIETVHLVEFITSETCQVTFRFENGTVSYPKVLNPGRVISFQDLQPIKSIVITKGVSGATLEVGIAV